MTVRCFIGLPIPEECAALLETAQKRLKRRIRSKVSWVRPENWHLTLKFLGDVFEERLPQLRETLRTVAFSPFTMRIGPGGFFPNVRRPRVFWAGLAQGAGESAALARSIEDALAPLGFEPETRPFSAHLTVARVKRNEPDDWASALAILDESPWPVIATDRFVLWQSILGPQGPKYRVIEEFGAD